ncbi:hypothetical protein [Microcoleus sp. Pol12B5]|uniref:hypothetical protein n=1 Tax=Microcoleus sp. Pol12B5 TaxID=3055396 RepID=UPI002FD59622
MDIVTRSPNPLEERIIYILWQDELYEENLERYRSLADLSGAEIAKRIFEANIQKEYDCSLSNLHEQADYLKGLPIDTVPIDLFQAAMQVAIEQVNWDVVSEDENIAEAIRQIKS